MAKRHISRVAVSLTAAFLLLVASFAWSGPIFQHGVKSLPVNEQGVYQDVITKIDYAHKKIHDGTHYYWTNSSSIGINQAIGVLFVTNSTLTPHVVLRLTSTGAGTFTIYEGTTNSTAGTILTPRNRNRNFADASNHWLRAGATINSSGTAIYQGIFGSGNQQGGDIRSENEIILRKSTGYFFNATSTSAGNAVEVILDWYEEDEE